jgi:hypothetical protein
MDCMPRARLALVLLLAIGIPTAADAQAWRASILALDTVDLAQAQETAAAPDSALPERPILSPHRQPGLFPPIAGGILGGTVGLFAGGVIGSAISDEQTDTIEEGGLWGLAIGETLLLPIGVHVGNKSQGNLLADIAVSTGVGAATIALGVMSNDGEGFLVGTIAQFIAVVATERATAKLKNERAARAAWEASLNSRAGVKPWVEAGGDSARGGPTPATGDSIDGRTLRPPDLPDLDTQPPLIQPVVIATLAAVAGAYGGAYIGNSLDEDYSSEFLPTGAVVGYLIGETIAMPIGAHFGNARRGNFAGDLGVSVLGHLLAIGLGSVTNSGLVYLVGMGAQIAGTVANERAVATRRERRAEKP